MEGEEGTLVLQGSSVLAALSLQLRLQPPHSLESPVWQRVRVLGKHVYIHGFYSGIIRKNLKYYTNQFRSYMVLMLDSNSTRTNCPYAATFLDIYSISPPIYTYIYINTYIHIYKYIYIYIYMFYSSIF